MGISDKIHSGLNYIKGAGKTKDGKVIVKNFGYLTLLQIANYIFPLITVPYVARVIGVEGYGKIAFAGAIVLWFQAVADWGFNYTSLRDVSQNRGDSKKISEIFSNVLWARILLMFISYVLLALFVLFIPTFRDAADVIMVTSLILVGHVAYPVWFFQAMEQMKYNTILNVLAKLLFTIAVFIFIKEPSDYIFQPLLTSLGYLVSGLVAMYIIVFKFKVKIRRPSVKGVVSAIKNGANIFVNQFVPNLYNSLSTVILGFVGGDESTGLLDSGRKFSHMLYPVFSSFSLSFFPYLNRRTDNHTKYAMIILPAAAMVSIVLFFGAPLLVRLFFGEEFIKSVPVVRLSALAFFSLVLSNVYATNYLLILRKDRLVRNITLVLSIFGAAIAYPLILWFDYMGAMLAYTVTTVLMGVVPAYYAITCKKQNVNNAS